MVSQPVQCSSRIEFLYPGIASTPPLRRIPKPTHADIYSVSLTGSGRLPVISITCAPS